MPLLIRQIDARELAAYEAAGWAQWPEAVPLAGPEVRGWLVVALQVPGSLQHQDLMTISAAPLQGLAAVGAAAREYRTGGATC